MRPEAPLLIDTADFGHAKCRAINATNSLLALPSTGGDFSWASHGPLPASSKVLTRAFGLTFTWMSFMIRLNVAKWRGLSLHVFSKLHIFSKFFELPSRLDLAMVGAARHSALSSWP